MILRGPRLSSALILAALAFGALPATLADGLPEGDAMPMSPTAARKATGLPAAKRAHIVFRYSAFPYRGKDPETGEPFLDMKRGKRRGHLSSRGGVYWEKITYSDRRTLLYIPKGFDVKRPAMIIVFFHGNEARLIRDVRDRQQVLRQIERSGLNAVLVAPQLAVDAKDSSAGHFWTPGFFKRYLKEAANRLSAMHGGARMRQALAKAPVVLVAYSGGYLPAAYSVEGGGLESRLAGLILLDAPYGDEERIADWLTRRPSNAFLVSAFGPFAREGNAKLREILVARGVAPGNQLPAQITPGSVSFVDLGEEVDHHDFVTRAWTESPLADLLARIPGYARAP